MSVDKAALERFGDNSDEGTTEDLLNQARGLIVTVYTNKAELIEDYDLGKVRTYKFLNNRSTLLKLLPPSEHAFLEHLKRATYATIIDTKAHIAKPDISPFTEFGWVLKI